MDGESSIIKKIGRMRLGGSDLWYPLIVIVVFVGVLVTIVVSTMPRGFRTIVAETPEAAAQQNLVQMNNHHAHSFTHLMTKEYHDFAVVVYGVPSHAYDTLYHQIVRRDGRGWYIDDISGRGGSNPRSAEGLGDYIKWTYHFGFDTVVVYGISISDDVAAVELFYWDGNMIRTAVEDGLFLLAPPGQWGQPPQSGQWPPPGIRAIDAEGNVLGEHDNAHATRWADEDA